MWLHCMIYRLTNSSMAVALLLPVTYAFEPTGAFIMFAGIYFGAMYGLRIAPVNRSPYESLKSRGLGLVSDPALRMRIAEVYDRQYGMLDELKQTQRPLFSFGSGIQHRDKEVTGEVI